MNILKMIKKFFFKSKYYPKNFFFKSLAHLGMHESHNVRDEELNEEELTERF